MWKKYENQNYESYVEINRILEKMQINNQKNEDKMKLLEYFMRMIKRELSIVYRNKVLYYPFLPAINIFQFFPSTKKVEVEYFEFKGIDSFQVNDETVVFPWSLNRLCMNYLNLKNKLFQIEQIDSHGVYLQELDLLFITKGNHSFTTFMNEERPNLIVKNIECYSIKKMFDLFETNGIYWIDKRTKKKIQKVKEGRIALLFFLMQKRFEVI